VNRELQTVNLSAFPKRSLGLAEGTGTARKIIVLFLSGLFFTGCFAVFALALGPGVLEDIRLSKEGKLAVRGTVGGEIRTRLFVSWGDLKLDYTIPGRGHNEGATSFSRNKNIFFVGDFDDSKDAQIYYLENDPSIATASYALDLLLNREITLVVSLAIELGFVIMAIAGCFRVAAVARSLRRAADRPEPIEVTIVRTRFYRRRQYIRYEWQNQRRRQTTVSWRQDRDPLFTGPTRDRALAIKGPDGYAHLVDSEFRPFELSEEEREGVLGSRARS
jgi:hypothetical protein